MTFSVSRFSTLVFLLLSYHTKLASVDSQSCVCNPASCDGRAMSGIITYHISYPSIFISSHTVSYHLISSHLRSSHTRSCFKRLSMLRVLFNPCVV